MSFLNKLNKLINRTLLGSLILIGGYSAILVMMCLPETQKMGLFLNFINYPFGVDWDIPEQFGFPRNKVKNFKFQTPDGLALGAWHILPTNYYVAHQLRDIDSVEQSVYDTALTSPEYNTVLYFHGNAGNRASPTRIQTYQKFADKFNVNVITIDYRGFGNSEGSPSEDGLRIDAKAIWDWLMAKGVPNEKVILLGHSLGSGVATWLASDVSLRGTSPKLLVLKAAYSSIAEVLPEYSFLQGYVPLLRPLKPFPRIQQYILSHLNHFFDSMMAIQYANCPIYLFHGGNDYEIPGINSRRLFHRAIHGKNVTFSLDFLETDPRISKRIIKNEAVRYDFSDSKEVTMIEVQWAHHNNVPIFEIVWDVLAEKMGEERLQ